MNGHPVMTPQLVAIIAAQATLKAGHVIETAIFIDNGRFQFAVQCARCRRNYYFDCPLEHELPIYHVAVDPCLEGIGG